MNPELIRQKLLVAARSAAPSDRVPYAFEKRVMASLAGRVPDVWAAWGALLWRAVVPCFAVMILAGVGSTALSPGTEDLGAQLDAVLLADLDTGSY